MENCTTTLAAAIAAAAVACLSGACTKDPASPSGGNAPQFTAPAIEAPSDDEQLTTLRPTLVARNGSSNPAGTRTYEFQISTSSSFQPIAASRGGIAEDASGRTSYTPDADLQSTTRYYWRVRVAQGSATSDWTSPGRFRTKAVGYNNARELYDPLVAGDTVGTISGSTTWIPGKGLKLNSSTSYVRYALPATVSSGEFSMEIEGLAPGGPIGKPRLFSMLDGTGRLDLSKYQMNVQYRGTQGNPDNCIAFKAVWGDEDVKLEPELHERHASVVSLDPSKAYFWQATWTATEFRLVVRDGGPGGPVIYNRFKASPPGYGPYAPSPHFAYLGANEVAMGGEDGTFPGVTIRNVWLGDKPRPASLGSAIRDR